MFITHKKSGMTTRLEMICAKLSQSTTNISQQTFLLRLINPSYVIPALPLSDGKELEYRELMNGIQALLTETLCIF